MALQKREKNMLKILGVVAVLGAISLVFTFSGDDEPVVEQAATTETKALEKPTAAKSTASRPASSIGGSRGGGSSTQSGTAISLSLDAFQKHNTEADCWVLVDGFVYDITQLVASNSINSEATEYCGTTGFEVGFLDKQSNIKESILTKSQKIGKIG